ncbi:MAG: hypothetical protein WDZ52_07225 [Pseudohongiellaceae bacterium]
MVDLVKITEEYEIWKMIKHAELHGDNRKIAAWIETENEITPEIRGYLVRELKGEIKRKQGSRKTIADPKNINSYYMAMVDPDLLGMDLMPEMGGRIKGRKTKAIEKLAEKFGVSVSTIKNYLANK